MNVENKISIGFPLRGEWQFLRPPGHHPFAFDFVKMDEKKRRYSQNNKILYFIKNIPANKYYCWDQPIYSPINGQVIQTGTEWEDHSKTNFIKTLQIWYNATYKFRPKKVSGRLDIRPNAGNYIMIKAIEGYIVFLAHLRNQSIKVEEGQFVKFGDLIGSVGNSGNSTEPHLHINIFDQMKNPLQAKVIPFVFTEYEELDDNNKWKKHTLSVPRIKSFIKL